MDAESRQLVDCMEKKGVYDALQRKDLKAVLSCIVETVVDAASLRYCGSETQHVMRNITPHHIRNLAWKMVGTLGQLKRIDLDKMSSDSDSQIIPTKENQYNAKDENDEGLSVNDDVKRPVKEAMDDAGLQKSQMDEFVLAGGSTRIPKIQQLLKDFFEGKERSKGVNPEEKEKIKASTKEALDWLDEKLKEVEAADNSLHSGSFGEEGDTSDDDDDDDDIKRDGISKKGTYYQCEKQASSSRGKEDASNDQLDSSSSRDSEYDNMEDEEGRMFAPKRRGVLGRCPELGKEGRNYVSRKLARRCLGNTRYGLLKESNPNRSKLGFSDSGGAMLLFWEPPSLPRKYVSRNRTRENMEIVAGYVRDQLEHLLCWAYASADLISASLVLHGWEKEYKPLCARYLNDKVAPQRLGQDLQGADLDDSNIHTCYGYNAKRALLYVQQHGIPEEKEVTFNCNHTRPEYPNEKMHGITDVFRYHTLEQALVRLKSHPVVANLLVYTGWDQNGIYRGPKTSGAQREGNGDHQVLMLDCREINGERVIHCKSSNGRDHTFCGYIDVSLEVMVMYICKEGDDEDDDLCSLRPQYLLSDFFSVGMETGPFGLQFKLKPNREKRNLKFRYIQNEGENESYQFLKRIGSGSLVPTGRCIRLARDGGRDSASSSTASIPVRPPQLEHLPMDMDHHNENKSISICSSGKSNEESPRCQTIELQRFAENKEFRLRGERSDAVTASMLLRIGDSSGKGRIVHFAFYLSSDTATAIAEGMVEELHLTSQEVIVIADMIDDLRMQLHSEPTPEDHAAANQQTVNSKDEEAAGESVAGPVCVSSV